MHIKNLYILELVTNLKEKGTSYRTIDDVCYIAGSNDVDDWKVNFTGVVLSNYHQGFLKESKRLVIPSCVKKLVGYSQGAAIANIVAIERGLECVGYATPGYCSKKTKNTNVINYRLSGDPIWLSPFQVDNLQVISSSKILKVSHHSLKAYQNFV